MKALAAGAKWASLILASLVVLIPLVVVLFAALKTHREYNATGPLTPPHNWFNLANFRTAWTNGDMLRGFLNTTIILVVSRTGTILVGSLAAYAVSRFTFSGKPAMKMNFCAGSPEKSTEPTVPLPIAALTTWNSFWNLPCLSNTWTRFPARSQT